MTTELTSEEIVTNLLSSNEILQKQTEHSFMSNPTSNTLGNFLLRAKEEYKTSFVTEEKSGKYVFIRQ